MEFHETNIDRPIHVSEGDIVRVRYRKCGSNDVVEVVSTVQKTVVPDGWDSVKSFYIPQTDDDEVRRLRCRVASGINESVMARCPNSGRQKPVGHLLEVEQVSDVAQGTIRIDDESVNAAM